MFKLFITFLLTFLKIIVYSKAEYYKPFNKCDDCFPPSLFMQDNSLNGYPCLPQKIETQSNLLKRLLSIKRDHIDSGSNCVDCIIPQKNSAFIAGRPQKQDIEIDIKKSILFLF